MAEFVTIRHPDLPDAQPARVTKRAFELIHQPKGWEVVGDAPATDPEPARSLSISEQIEQAKSAAGVTDAAPAETTTEGAAPADKPAKRVPRPAADGQEG